MSKAVALIIHLCARVLVQRDLKRCSIRCGHYQGARDLFPDCSLFQCCLHKTKHGIHRCKPCKDARL